MSRSARVLVTVLVAATAAGAWLFGHPARAHAQATTAKAASSRYQLSVLENAAQPQQARWVVLDTETGAMELWVSQGGGFDVTRLQFSGVTNTTRHIVVPEIR